MIPVCKPFWGVEEEQAVVRVMRSGRLIQGPEVERFEQAVAQFVGVKYAIACSSGTTALHLALMACGVQPGDEVLVPAFTFVATANAVLHCAANPVLCDIELSDFNLLLEELDDMEAAIVVHAFGQPADIKNCTGLIIEDAACALGSFNLKGQAATLSFHATKAVTCSEGGMVLTDDAEVAAVCRLLRDQKHGQSLAYNYRMTEVQGAVGCEQMLKLPAILNERLEIAALYDAEWQGKIRARIPPHGGNYQSYVLLLDQGIDRGGAVASLVEKGVEALPGTQFLGDMPHLCQFVHGPLTNARIAGERAMRVPIWPGMSDEQIEQVVRAVLEVLT